MEKIKCGRREGALGSEGCHLNRGVKGGSLRGRHWSKDLEGQRIHWAEGAARAKAPSGSVRGGRATRAAWLRGVVGEVREKGCTLAKVRTLASIPIQGLSFSLNRENKMGPLEKVLSRGLT